MKVDIEYCYESCEKGREFAKKAVWECESIFDAAFDFECFTKECFKTCPHKQFHEEMNDDN